jgi:hypothetical protein
MSSVKRSGRGHERVEIPPEQCPNGHLLKPPTVAVGHLPCSCAGIGGHRTYTCQTCGLTVYVPPHTDPSLSAGRVRGR